jgi:hypothetical protein
MDNIAAGSASDRRDLFQESASRLGMNPTIVEKDFWVCWILKLLFAEPALKNQMVFKGGTSLSKVFGLIDRFSEDIDLVLDWRLLGYDQAGANDPFQAASSKSKQTRYNLEMNARLLRTSGKRCSLNSTVSSRQSRVSSPESTKSILIR